MLSPTIQNHLNHLLESPSVDRSSCGLLLFPSLPTQLPLSFRPMCTPAGGGGDGQPASRLDSGSRLAMAPNGDMASDLEFPSTEVLVGWHHAHSMLWCVLSVWVWTFFMYRKQRKESEFERTMAILKNGSDFKQKYASSFPISTYLERSPSSCFDGLPWMEQRSAFHAELCGDVWWNEPLGAHGQHTTGSRRRLSACKGLVRLG